MILKTFEANMLTICSMVMMVARQEETDTEEGASVFHLASPGLK